MARGILGKKIGMTQYFAEDGKRVGVTVVECQPNYVLQIKTTETKDGYNAIQLGIDPMKEKHSTKPMQGHAKKAGVAAACRFIREIRVEDTSTYTLGGTVTLQSLEGLEKIMITGISKGKGFAGGMKRHGFAGHRATHGVKCHHRNPGSIGSNTYPSRVFRNKRMPGHMGVDTITSKGVKIAKILADKNLILLMGSVPGANGCYVFLREDVGYVDPTKKAAKKK